MATFNTVTAGDVPSSNVIFRKTKMCKFFLMDKCTRSHACNFAHDDSELQPLPDFHYTRMCADVCANGRCERGDACTFAHSVRELRQATKGRWPEMRAKEGSRVQIPQLPGPLGLQAQGPPGQLPRRVGRQETSQIPEAGQTTTSASAIQQVPGLAALAEAHGATLQSGAAGQSVLLVTQAFTLPVENLQGLLLGFPQLVLGDSGAGTQGMTPSAEAVGPQQESMPQGFPAGEDTVEENTAEADMDDLNDDIEESCEKLELGASSWSRQSTEDGCFEVPAAFSRQSTQETWVPVEELRDEDKSEFGAPLAACKEETSGDETSSNDAVPQEAESDFEPSIAMDLKKGDRRESPEVSPEMDVLFPRLAVGMGLAFAVKNTFLEFRSENENSKRVRRAHSTGDRACAL